VLELNRRIVSLPKVGTSRKLLDASGHAGGVDRDVDRGLTGSQVRGECSRRRMQEFGEDE
jgi:hypothetical protein